MGSLAGFILILIGFSWRELIQLLMHVADSQRPRGAHKVRAFEQPPPSDPGPTAVTARPRPEPWAT